MIPAPSTEEATRSHVLSLAILSAGALVAGVFALRNTSIGFTWTGAGRGVAGQLGTTVPAGLAMTLAVAVNIGAGAVIMRFLRGRPYESKSELVAFGFSGAVLFDFVLLMGLGGPALFVWPVLVAAHVLVLLAGRRYGRPMLVSASGERPIPLAAWVLAASGWAAPIVLQLSAPVVAYMDVLPQYVTPAEHVRSFGSLETITTMPHPMVGPWGMQLGFTAVLGMLDSLTRLRAVVGAPAFVLSHTILLAVTSCRFARSLFGPLGGFMALFTVPLSLVFLRLPDTRATVMVFPLALTALTPFAASSPRARSLTIAGLLGATLLVHPNIASLALLAHLLLAARDALLHQRDVRPEIAGAAGAVVLAVPQALSMLEIGLPSPVALAAVPAAVAVAWAGPRARLPVAGIVRTGMLALAALLLSRSVPSVGKAAGFLADVARAFPLITMAFVVATSLRRLRASSQVLWAAVGAAVLAAVLATLVPGDETGRGLLRQEIASKGYAYWVPVFLSVGAAGALAELVRSKGKWGPVAAALFVVAAALPLRPQTVVPDSLEEHRIGESLSVSLHHAELGYWQRYPDARHLIDGPRRELVEVFRREHRRGRVARDTRVLQVAQSPQAWVATPLAVFSGVHVTSFSVNPERSPQTLGGRLRPLEELSSYLGPRYRYVVLEPAGLPADLRPDIVQAGYRSIFVNVQGEIFRRSAQKVHQPRA